MFDIVVQLYRESGSPKLEGGGSVFSYSGIPSEALLEVFHKAQSLPKHLGAFLEDDEDNGTISFKWSLAESNTNRIYEDVSDFVIRTPSLSRGEVPSDYYIGSIEYRAGDEISDHELQLVESGRELISLLASLTDHRLEETIVAGAAVLTFIAPADAGKAPKTIRLTTRISIGILKLPAPDLKVLKDLLSDDVKLQLHIEERKSIFRIAVSEMLRSGKQGGDAFEGLIQIWPEVLVKYRHDLDCYIYGYSFDKLRREIATAELEYTTKLGGVLKDFSGKLYGLPISFAALIPLATPKVMAEVLLIIGGMILLSLIISSVIWNQRIEMTRIKHSYTTIFDQFNKKISDYPVELQRSLMAAKDGVEKQRKLLSRTLFISYFLSWIPPFAGIAVMISAELIYK